VPDTPPRTTRLQRVALWILGALMFYIVALYPNLLMARFQPDDVVHYGFLKWMAVVLILYAVAAQLFFTERPAESRPGRQTLAVTAALLLIIGIFSPIVSFSFVGDIDFFRAGYGDGYILLIMAVASLALAVTGRWKQVLVPALGGLAVILWTFLGVQDTIAEARSGGSAVLAGNPHEGLAAATMASIQWEWGWLPLFAGSGLLVYSAARRDRMEDETPPWATVADDDEPEPVATAEAEAAGGEAATAEAPAVEAEAGQAEEAVTVEEAAPAEETAPTADEPAETTAEKPAEAATESPAEASATDAPEEPAAGNAAAAPAAETPAADASAPEPVTTASDADTAESVAAPDAGAAATAKAESADEKAESAAETTATNAESAPAATESDAAPTTGATPAGNTGSAGAAEAADETGEPKASASKPESAAKEE